MNMDIDDRVAIKRILCLFRPYIKEIVLILSCMLLSAGISMVIPRISQQLMDKGLLAHNYELLIIFALSGLALLLADQSLGFIEAKNRIYLNSILSFTLSKNAFKHKENIALNTKMDELHIFEAVKECGISEFIEKLPDKYETVVGRNGTGMSGGERQKIALARAIIRDSKILVLDETTANYDIESKAAIK